MATTAKTTAIRTGKASPPHLFRHVSPGPDDSTLKFRLLHLWEARKNIKGGPGILLGIEMLMIDAERFVSVALNAYNFNHSEKNTWFCLSFIIY
ncbi:BnaCnng25460D [Brassica napus]|uniref:BnaCnng25460D protein n=1 Tax=Brassica napus TaxID=3708 RepID=A0A078IWJ3_BRANA|nr:BnaCnng25460D [Brassica napus]